MPQVFVSHSAKDRALVEREIISPLKSRGVQTWYSTDDIKSAVEWEKKIREGLDKCDWFLVALSPNSVKSDWVHGEVDWALEHRKGRVISVLIEECRPSDLHLLLRRIQYIDFRSDTDKAQQKLLSIWGLDTATQVLNEYNLAQKAIKDRELTVAIGHLEKVLRLDPAHANAQAELKRARQVVNSHRIALEAMAREDWASAITNFEAVLRLDSAHEEARAGLDRARRQGELASHYATGLTHLSEGRAHEALKAFRLVRKIDRSYRNIAERIADADAEMEKQEGNGVRGLQNLPQTHISEGPNKTPPTGLEVITRGWWSIMNGFKNRSQKYQLTRNAFIGLTAVILIAVVIFLVAWLWPYMTSNNAGVAHGTTNTNTQVPNSSVSDNDPGKLGDSLFKERKYAEAEKEYARVLQEQPDAKSIQLKLGKALFAQTKNAEALRELEKATRILPSAEAYFYYGRSLIIARQFAFAEKQLREAIRLDPNNAEHHYYLGVALSWQKKWDATIEAYEKTLQLDPTHKEAREELENVRNALR